MREPLSVRRMLPAAAARSLRLAAAWTGAAAAAIAAVVAIAVVAILWLPAANGSGSAAAAIRAGVLTFLAALHGGVTVDGLPSTFVPLGMTLLVGAIAWRAGSGLADTAAELDEPATARLVEAAALQAGVFAAVCGVAAGYATVGTSSVSAFAAGSAGFGLFAVTGGVAFVRASPLADELRERMPGWLGPSLRPAVVGVAVYLGAGALLVAGSLVVHHARVEELSGQVGGGWSGVPILLLGVLTVPNAVIGGAAYLSGPGFAVGSGSGVSLHSAVHGTLPAFPVLGAVPSGPATVPVWLLVAVTPLLAGICAARAVWAAPSWPLRLRNAAAGTGLAALFGALLAWQGGGGIGSGRLSAFGASPWQFGLALGAAIGVGTAAMLGTLAVIAWARARIEQRETASAGELAAVLATDEDGDEPPAEELAAEELAAAELAAEELAAAEPVAEEPEADAPAADELGQVS